MLCRPVEILHQEHNSGVVVEDNHGRAAVTSPRDRGEALILHEGNPSHVVSTSLIFESTCALQQIGVVVYITTMNMSEAMG